MRSKKESYNSFVTKEGNKIWSASMQLVWNEVRSSFTHNLPLVFIDPSKEGLVMIDRYNKLNLTQQILPKDGFYIKSGFGPKTIKEINKQLKKRFNSCFQVKEQISKSDFICYTYLTNSVTFLNKFQFRKDKSFRFNDRPVQSFYAKYFQQKQQIKCFFYQNSLNFLIQVRLRQAKSQIFFIKSPAIKTTESAISTVMSSIAGKKSFSLVKNDKFQMPLINIHTTKEYSQMQGLQFRNKQLQNYRIKKMYEEVKFEINECGAILQSQAVLIGFKSPMTASQQPKEFHLDRSFWIVLKEEQQHPYFCVYIDNVCQKGQ